MKRLLNLFVVTILALTAVTFTGCSKDDDEFTLEQRCWRGGYGSVDAIEGNTSTGICTIRGAQATFMSEERLAFRWLETVRDKAVEDGDAGTYVAKSSERRVKCIDKKNIIIFNEDGEEVGKCEIRDGQFSKKKEFLEVYIQEKGTRIRVSFPEQYSPLR